MTPHAIYQRLQVTFGINGPPMRVLDAVEAELRSHFGLSAIAAVERAEELTPKVLTIIKNKQVRNEKVGLLPVLRVIGTCSDTISGYCYILPGESGCTLAIKRNRLQVGALFEEIRGLTFAQFEKFCAKVLIEIGASYSRITPHGGDQGIDFFGHLTLGSLQSFPESFFQLAHDVRMTFVGQAKHYLITHEPQPISAADMASAACAPRPM